MATKIENLDLEKKHFNQIKLHLPNYQDQCEKTINWALDLGLIQVSTAFEQALAAVGNHTVISIDAADLDDGSDGKLSSVRTCWNGRNYSAPVTNTYGKTGDLRVQVYERKTDKFYYFIIPYTAYSTVGVTSNIDIPFEINGEPKRIPKRLVKNNWWRYEVKDFETVCQTNFQYCWQPSNYLEFRERQK